MHRATGIPSWNITLPLKHPYVETLNQLTSAVNERRRDGEQDKLQVYFPEIHNDEVSRFTPNIPLPKNVSKMLLITKRD